MFTALLHGKLDAHLTRPSSGIEDLLTSVVFDGCRLSEARDALLPFLGLARSAFGEPLARSLANVEGPVDYEFWLDWRQGVAPSLHAAPGEPELLLTLARAGQPPALVLIEAKLWSGKSSRPSAAGVVTDQLGKYWLHLSALADRLKAEPLAIVYLVQGVTTPDAEFAETQRELEAKGHLPAPLYWLSWRWFTAHIPEGRTALLDEVRRLLIDWGLVHEEMRPWPAAPPRSAPFRFLDAFAWPGAPVSAPWNFSQTWTWLAPPRSDRWTFDEEHP